jgi:hypothetical protein
VRGFGRGEAVRGSAYRSGGVVSRAAYGSGERLHNHEQGAPLPWAVLLGRDEGARPTSNSVISGSPAAPVDAL